MGNYLLEKSISNQLDVLRKQSRSLQRLINKNAPLFSLLSNTSALRKSLRLLDNLLIERFVKSNFYRYRYAEGRTNLIQEVVSLYRFSS